jgi:hypothetical protein
MVTEVTHRGLQIRLRHQVSSCDPQLALITAEASGFAVPLEGFRFIHHMAMNLVDKSRAAIYGYATHLRACTGESAYPVSEGTRKLSRANEFHDEEPAWTDYT